VDEIDDDLDLDLVASTAFTGGARADV